MNVHTGRDDFGNTLGPEQADLAVPVPRMGITVNAMAGNELSGRDIGFFFALDLADG